MSHKSDGSGPREGLCLYNSSRFRCLFFTIQCEWRGPPTGHYFTLFFMQSASDSKNGLWYDLCFVGGEGEPPRYGIEIEEVLEGHISLYIRNIYIEYDQNLILPSLINNIFIYYQSFIQGVHKSLVRKRNYLFIYLFIRLSFFLSFLGQNQRKKKWKLSVTVCKF